MESTAQTLVAQRSRAAVFETEGSQVRILPGVYALLAQWTEHSLAEREAEGSSPSGRASSPHMMYNYC